MGKIEKGGHGSPLESLFTARHIFAGCSHLSRDWDGGGARCSPPAS